MKVPAKNTNFKKKLQFVLRDYLIPSRQRDMLSIDQAVLGYCITERKKACFNRHVIKMWVDDIDEKKLDKKIRFPTIIHRLCEQARVIAYPDRDTYISKREGHVGAKMPAEAEEDEPESSRAQERRRSRQEWSNEGSSAAQLEIARQLSMVNDSLRALKTTHDLEALRNQQRHDDFLSKSAYDQYYINTRWPSQDFPYQWTAPSHASQDFANLPEEEPNWSYGHSDSDYNPQGDEEEDDDDEEEEEEDEDDEEGEDEEDDDDDEHFDDDQGAMT